MPASRYARCSQKTPARKMPARCPKPQYPGHVEVRKVSTTGAIKFKARPLFVSAVLAGEYVGLEEVDDGLWSLLFDTVLLGRLDERSWTIHPGHPSWHPS